MLFTQCHARPSKMKADHDNTTSLPVRHILALSDSHILSSVSDHLEASCENCLCSAHSLLRSSLLFRILLVGFHNPPTMVLRVVLHLLRILEQFQNLTRLRHIIPLLHRRIGHHAVPPRLQQRKLINIHTCPPSPKHPPDMRYIRNRHPVIHQILRLGRLEMLLQHRV
jgi:hypothetical protein